MFTCLGRLRRPLGELRAGLQRYGNFTFLDQRLPRSTPAPLLYFLVSRGRYLGACYQRRLRPHQHVGDSVTPRPFAASRSSLENRTFPLHAASVVIIYTCQDFRQVWCHSVRKCKWHFSICVDFKKLLHFQTQVILRVRINSSFPSDPTSLVVAVRGVSPA